MSAETEHKDGNIRKNIFIPFAYTLLWILGLSLTLYLTLEKTGLSEMPVEVQTVAKFGIVFVLFLCEIIFNFMDIAHSHLNKQFSSKVFKTMGYILGDIVLTIVLVVYYVVQGQPTFLFLFLLTTAFIKYIYVYMSKNVEAYIANNIHRPNPINHGQ